MPQPTIQRVLTAIDRLKNCGIGSGGFQPGNSCARGGGGGTFDKAVEAMPEGTKRSKNVPPGYRDSYVYEGVGRKGVKASRECFEKLKVLGFKGKESDVDVFTKTRLTEMSHKDGHVATFKMIEGRGSDPEYNTIKLNLK